jgi:hypothetical protein
MDGTNAANLGVSRGVHTPALALAFILAGGVVRLYSFDGDELGVLGRLDSGMAIDTAKDRIPVGFSDGRVEIRKFSFSRSGDISRPTTAPAPPSSLSIPLNG